MKTGSPDNGKGLWPRRLKSGSPEQILWQEVQHQDKGDDCPPGREGSEETAILPRLGLRLASPEVEKGGTMPDLSEKDRKL